MYNQKNNCMFLVLLIIYSIYLFGYKGLLVLIINMLLWILIGFILYRDFNRSILDLLISLLLFSVPISFRDVFGRDYGILPVSWFNIFLMLLLIVILCSMSISGFMIHYIGLISGIIILSCTAVLLGSTNIINAIKQYINLLAYFLTVIFAFNIKSISSKKHLYNYIVAVRVTSIELFIQYFVYKCFNINVGNIKFFGGNREAFGFIFNDFSFLSLFFVTGCLFVLCLKPKFWMLDFLIFTLASMITSARAGIVSLAITLIIISFVNVIRNLSRYPLRVLIYVLIIFIVITGVLIGMTMIRPEDFLSDSGRLESYIVAFDLFAANFLIGVGFGVNNYEQITQSVIPHNLIIQYLVQGGFVLIIPLTVFVLLLLYFAYRRVKPLFFIILGTLLGAMFIPDIFNSRFFLVITLLTIISRNIKPNYFGINLKNI